MNDIRLTQFSPGAGCGCKISLAELEKILTDKLISKSYSELLVGNDTRDDAAVYDIGNGQAVISTTDFFTPIVDSPYDFGRIAAANALSDVYAMGGSPLMAISILGWPVDKLSIETAGFVLEGAAEICSNAGIPLAGGHSIDISDPVFGLAVTGIISPASVKRNSTATDGCRLYLSKPIGTGIISTAGKKGLLAEEDYSLAVYWMTKLNNIGSDLGKMTAVKAMTDVTGFGLLGHLLEVCEGSQLSAVIEAEKVPLLDNLEFYITRNCIPGGTFRNWKSYDAKIGEIEESQKLLFTDPQTSGGLLIAVDKNPGNEFIELVQNGELKEIGYMKKRQAGKPVVSIQ
ncbi:MAG: selenide, water dikinase SelD [Bacteroidales bacterium]|nr:selenide, water dikinase SelD [Bacteroidales bacterium]MBN2762010.1 selenide, water dikinase SelD [Bacteroidales bacterium]